MSGGFDQVDVSGPVRWRPPPPPPLVRIDTLIEAVPFMTGWNRALGRSPQVLVRRFGLTDPPPRVISVAIGRERIPVQSFAFPERASGPYLDTGARAAEKMAGSPTAAGTRRGAGGGPGQRNRQTRIRPPDDVVKLKDRLHYLLQPSLESLLAERSLAFPFHPFAYQLEGIAFLCPRHAAILADEMGLGKTMQAITAIRLLLHSGELRSVLLVCPKPLVTNWQREFDLWAPEIPVLVIQGEGPKRRWQWERAQIPVKIVNYELLHRDRETFEARDASGRARVRFDLAILDEAQRIKNRACATSQAVRLIPRRLSWALTGTPVENSSEDLVGIFDFLAPGFLSPEMKPRRMGRAIRDYVLRRTKDQVLADLPPKLYRNAELSLAPEQRQTYQMAESQGVLRLTAMGEGVTIQHVFELILRLKQICNFDPATGASSKLERLEADLEEVAASGRKAIVFSQWVETLQRLARHLRRFGPLQYHGRVPSRRRDAVIRRFREASDCGLMLISYGAGGVGLNLQCANYVFLFDRWWNPAVEDQAINRAHRIGATGPVTITRFLMLDTIEERIQRILEEKRGLFDAIFSDAPRRHKLGLTQEELFGLFNLNYPGGPVNFAA